MAKAWDDFQFRLAQGETVKEIVDLEQSKASISEQSKAFESNVLIGGKSYSLKPMVPDLIQLTEKKDDCEKLVVPHPSVPVSELLPL